MKSKIRVAWKSCARNCAGRKKDYSGCRLEMTWARIDSGAEKKEILQELDSLRVSWDWRLVEILVGARLTEELEDRIAEGGHYIRLINGAWVNLERLDEGFLARHSLKLRDHAEEMVNHLEEQGEKEYAYRRDSIRRYIAGKGLRDFTDEIIEGLNRSAKRVVMGTDTRAFDSGNFFRWRNVLLSDYREMLKVGLEYVDRWKKYHEIDWDAEPTKRHDGVGVGR